MDISVVVPRDEEAYYRKSAAIINERLNAYFGGYKGRKSDKEICYYAMIDMGLSLAKQMTRNDTAPYDKILSQLTSEIESILKEK